MKNVIAITLVLLCAFLLSACGANPAGDQTTAAVPTLETLAGDGSVTDPAILTEPDGMETSEEAGAPTESKPEEADAPTESKPEGEDFVIISTPYADLRLPASFDKAVSHEETSNEPYVITFKSRTDETELFSIIFNGTGEYLVGTLMGEEKNTVVHANTNDLDQNDQNYESNLFYQEQLYLILGYLAEDYNLVPEEAIDDEDPTDFEIQTSLVTLYYPSRWKEKVEIEVLDNGVKFSAAGTPLFDLMFEECDGYLLGTYQETPIYMVEYPVETEEQAAMQAGVNTILQHLTEDPSFTIN